MTTGEDYKPRSEENRDVRETLFSLGQWLLKGVLGVAVMMLVIVPLIQWMVSWFIKRHNANQSSVTSEMQDKDDKEQERLRRKQNSAREELQRDHMAKAEGFKERILTPREEAKQKKKEESFCKFLGPAWRGKGVVLGEDEGMKTKREKEFSRNQDKCTTPGQKAAALRRIQSPTPQPSSQKPVRQKQIIKLPEEPEETAESTVLVILRSPLQTSYRRRFHQTDTAQTLLDFMTISGFNQSYNTLCTSYPRQDIGVDRNVTLQQLGFQNQVTLNIEEKEM